MDEGYLKICIVFAMFSGSLLLPMAVSGFTIQDKRLPEKLSFAETSLRYVFR